MKEKIIAAVVALAITLFVIFMTMTPAQAATNPSNITSIDVNNLTAEQKAAILTQVTQMQADKPAEKVAGVSETLRDEATKWGELGSNMGKAAVGAAREVGIAANEFVSTPLGKITMGVVVYKIVGRELFHLVFGVIFTVTIMSIGLYMILRVVYTNQVFEYQPGLFNAYQKKVIISQSVDDKVTGERQCAGIFIGLVGLVVGMFITFS